VRRADQVVGLVLFVSAVIFTAVARQFAYRSPTGPGPGFLPFWLGLALTTLSALLFLGATRRPAAAERWRPTREGQGRLLAVLVATVLLVALLNVTGMVLGCALFLVALLRLVERHSWPQTLGVAAGAAAANYLVFTYWLKVPFPVGPLGF
jgi:hypothetical protein